MKHKITLRIRITLIVAVILIMTTCLLTAFSISSSQRYFSGIVLDKNIVAQPDNALNKEVIEEDNNPNIGNLSGITANIQIEEAQRGFSKEQLIAMGLITAVGILITYWVVGKALKPLTELSTTAEQIDENNLNMQITIPSYKDEIHSLATSFNSMLTRLKSSFEIQKNFASNAAHELKTPLTIMKSSLQVLTLDDEPTVHDYEDNAKILSDNVERLIEIVDELLLISSSKEVEVSAVQLDNLVRESIFKYESTAKKRDIRISSILEPLQIYSNSILLLSIVNNLLSNAIKYNLDGGLVNIMLEQVENCIVFKISDTGIGISEEHIPHIFEAFYRADISRSKNVPGNGLGLQIVKTSVEKINASIEVINHFEQGTTFVVTIPIPSRSKEKVI